MKISHSILTALVLPLTVHAYVVVPSPSAPRSVFCSPNGPDGLAFASRPMAALIVEDADSDNVIRKNISAKVIRDYVEPALKESCAAPGEAFKFMNDASTACQKGCTETLGEWNLRGQARADMLEICRADCRGVNLMLLGMVLGSKAPISRK